jgi:transcriptional regulator with XRE-family HTH domain
MHGGDYISIARKRAGLTQRELAGRLGCRQATIARWERDDRHPSLDETQAAVRACGFDLGLNLVAEDRSWWPQIAVQLGRSPAERLRSLTPPGAPDIVAALELLSRINTLALVIGEVAGALHGWPLILSATGTVEVCGEADVLDEQFLANGLTESEGLYAMASGQQISVVQQPPGTTGMRDLARSAKTIDLSSGSIRLAGVLDLLRISDAADGGRRSRETLALQAVVEVERARAAAAPVTATNQERLQAWLDQQPAAA